MPSPSRSDRAANAARHALLWAVGPVVLAFRGPLVELAPPIRCAGALDLATILILRAAPTLEIGRLFNVLHIVCVTLALGCFAELASSLTRNTGAVAAVTLALGLSPLMTMTLAPPWEAAAFGACALVMLAVSASDGKKPSLSAVVGVGVAVVAVVLIAPPWMPVGLAAVLGFAHQRYRSMDSRSKAALALGVLAVFLAPIALSQATVAPGLGREGATTFNCILPAASSGGVLLATGVLTSMLGPVTLALAALGAFAAARQRGAGAIAVMAVLGALGFLTAPVDAWKPTVVLAPFLLIVWVGAAVGAAEIVAVIGGGRAVTIAGTLLIALIPVLERSRVAAQERDDIVRPASHERAALGPLTFALNQLPTGSRLVEEDASVDLLLRATVFGGRRASKPIAMVPISRSAVARALSSGPVYAFPNGQRELNLRGFVLEPIADPAQPGRSLKGIAMVSGTRRCADVGAAWVDLSGVGESGRIAVSVESEDARGPAIVYFGGTTGESPYADWWPRRVNAGFSARMFDRRSPVSIARFDEEATAVGAAGQATFALPDVGRMTVHRTPNAPRALPIVLGKPHVAGVARLAPEVSDPLPITICNAPGISLVEF